MNTEESDMKNNDNLTHNEKIFIAISIPYIIGMSFIFGYLQKKIMLTPAFLIFCFMFSSPAIAIILFKKFSIKDNEHGPLK